MIMRRSHLYVGIGVFVVIASLASFDVSSASIIEFSFWNSTDPAAGQGSFWLNLPADGNDDDEDGMWEFDKSMILNFNYLGMTAGSILSFSTSYSVYTNPFTDEDTDISLWSIVFFSGNPASDLNFAFVGTDLIQSLPDTISAYVFHLGSVTTDAAGYDFDSMTITPVPEPSSLALFCLGAVGLWGTGWRIRKSKRIHRNG
jgi:hypothetical protein